ncbi:MAG: tetratricopeptide repeat protein [Candidatus Thiodiazotropha sp. (ex Dulcina madagascariensis)]|nr:tetratricopeptide repeat protein [Candidatus Thiodiazotropha sp. (ex Dulcina madagascariensis)]MCU7927670.1 tetratricopeptide repeat protein [Candidatus Thiodiazotropha sp. (ex Dulcina madagascariensis)]
MKQSFYAYLSLLAVLLSGCSTTQKGSDEATLADLQKQQITIEKQALSPADSDEVIENYRALLQLNPDQRLSSEATRRLADLELERSETKLLQSSEPERPSEVELAKSVRLYEELLRKDPDYASRDLVLYQLARAYELQGDMPKMMQALQELVTRHPQSPHWQEAQFRRGERFFVVQRFGQAEKAYGAILARKEGSRYFDRALFKHGWSRFRQRNIEQGLDSFTHLLDRNLGDSPQVNAAKLSPADQELLKETLRVISLTFSELGGAKRIRRYFDAKGHRSYEYMIYQGLGDLYLKQERIQDAAEAYLAFVELSPDHPQSPRLAVRVVENYTKHGFPALAVESKKSFVKHYAVGSEAWKKQQASDQTWLDGQLRTYLKELAEYHHALAQQAKKRRTKNAAAEQAKQGREAARWYRLYLDAFADDPTAGSISFLLGELLFDLKNYAQAVNAYEASAYRLPAHDKRAEAGYAALLAYAAQEKLLAKAERRAWQLREVESALQFSNIFPQDPRMTSVLTEAADQLLKLQDLGRARGAALQVANLKPPADRKLQRTAWTIVAQAAFEQQDFPAAESAYRQALALLPKRDKGRAQLQERLAASIYQQGAALRTQGDHRGAAEQFLRIANRAPRASILATAEYDAAASLIAAGDWAGSIKILESYRARYPKSELIPEVNSKLAVAYMETRQPLKAAAELATISTQASTPELRREAGWRSAELYEKAAKHKQAIAAYKKYVKAFPAPLEQAVEARQRLVDLYQKTGQTGKRDWWLKQLIKVDANAGKQRSDRTRYLAAQATIRLAEPILEGFRRVKLKAPLEKNLKLKKRRMQEAIAAYKKAAEYAVAEVTTAATYRIGEMYQQFGAALMASERPKGLNAEELEQYEILLEEQAYPFEEKAITLHESNVERTASGIYDKWVKRSFAALAKLLPGRYAKQEKREAWTNALN